MAARAANSGLISLGLVNIPYKMYTVASSTGIKFNQLHNKCKSRVKLQYICPTDEETVTKKDMVKGFEYVKGQFVTFTEEELTALQAAKSSNIEVLEFIPEDSLNFIQIEKSYYLGPDKAGDKLYRIFMEAMREKKTAAVGRFSARNKDQLVVIREYRGGMLLHNMFYGNEVRAFENAPANIEIGEKERKLAGQLIDQLLVDTIDNSKYYDRYAQRVREAADKKIANNDFVVATNANTITATIDMNDALKKTLAMLKARKSKKKTIAKKQIPNNKAARAKKKKGINNG